MENLDWLPSLIRRGREVSLWKTMVLWKKIWYFGKNYGTIPKTMEL